MKKQKAIVLGSILLFVLAFSGVIKSSRTQTDYFEFKVEAPEYLTGEVVHFQISGAQPNTPIYWTTWIDGVLLPWATGEHGFTDANGNFSKGETQPSSFPSGNWKRQVSINGVTASVEYRHVNTTVLVPGVGWNCNMPLSKCLEVAQQKGTTILEYDGPRPSFAMTTDINEIKDRFYVIHGFRSQTAGEFVYYHPGLDTILTLHRFRIQTVLNVPRKPCWSCESGFDLMLPSSYPAIQSNEFVFTTRGGDLTMNGIQVKARKYTYQIENAGYGGEWIFILTFDPVNPRLYGLATGPCSSYPKLHYPTDQTHFGDPRASCGYVGHPLVQFNVEPWKPNSGFYKTLPEIFNIFNN
jgi:hypothetical protein